MPPGKELAAKYIQIILVVAAYWVISIVTVFVNKALLSGETVNLNAPLFITWFQCVVSAIICATLSVLSKCFPNRVNFPSGNPFDWDTVKKVSPLSLVFTGMIASNNLCLKYVDVAFYYIGRSLTTVFNVIFTYLILGQKTSTRCVACCAIIITGFFLGVDQENILGSLSILGTFFGVFGSLTLSLYSIQTKRILPLVNEQVWLLSYYNNVYSVVLFLPLILISGELEVLYNYEKLFEVFFWMTMVMGGVCGFAIGYVTALQIQVTSPLTHNISGTAKACAQTVLASYWYDEHKPMLWWASNFVVLGASAAYARIKQLDMEKVYERYEYSRLKA